MPFFSDDSVGHHGLAAGEDGAYPQLVVEQQQVGVASFEQSALARIKAERPRDVFCQRLDGVAERHPASAHELATDKTALSKTVTYGYGKKAISFISESDPYFDKNLTDAHAYNIAKAKSLLAEAGKSNLTLNIMISSGSALYQQIATVLKEQWAQAGITLNITQLDRTAVKAAFKGLTYEVELTGWNNDITDTTEWVDYACVYANDKCAFTGWQNKDVETWAAQAKKELNTTKRQEYYSKIQESWQSDCPLIPLFSMPNLVAMKKTVTGFVQDPLGYYHFQDLANVQ